MKEALRQGFRIKWGVTEYRSESLGGTSEYFRNNDSYDSGATVLRC